MNNSGKTNGCLIAVIVFLVVIILVMAAIFFFFFAGKSDMPDVKEFISEVESSERTTDNNSSITDYIKIQTDETATSKIDITLTNADITALANDTADSSEDIPFKDILFNCNADETIDITGIVTDLSIYADNPDVPAIVRPLIKTANGKRLYATIYINYLGNNDFDIEIQDVKIEKFNVPIIPSLFGSMTDNIEQMLYDQLASQENFEMESFEIEEDQLKFSGTITN